MAFVVDGQPYHSLVWKHDPNSYALALQMVLQIMAAQRDGIDPLVLIDRFDTLDKPRQNAVLNTLVKKKINAIIAGTDARPDRDRLAAASVGRTYWIDEGIIKPVEV